MIDVIDEGYQAQLLVLAKLISLGDGRSAWYVAPGPLAEATGLSHRKQRAALRALERVALVESAPSGRVRYRPRRAGEELIATVGGYLYGIETYMRGFERTLARYLRRVLREV